ncbi:MAG: class I SAM-dependent methyltransferase [Candidatus Thorarchaeota archaeon]|jgi:SAM-dependent methyltransferase
MVDHLSKEYWSDSGRIPRLVDSYEWRYGPAFWISFLDLVGTESRKVVADFGCGPGMFLKDAADKFKAEELRGYDSRKDMLKAASKLLADTIPQGKVLLQTIDFEKEPIKIDPASVDLGFSGYVLHELTDPSSVVGQIVRTIRTGGIYTVFECYSGNEEAFVRAFVERGWPEERVRKSYPRMCKYSVDDIERILRDAGFSSVKHRKVDEFRVIAVGLNE